MDPTVGKGVPPAARGGHVYWRWAIAAVIVIVLFTGAFWMASPAISRVAREHVSNALQKRFAGSLEWKHLNLSVFPRVQFDMDEVIFHKPGTNELPPLITVRHISGATSIPNLFRKHLSSVRLEGLVVQVPPRSDRSPSEPGTATGNHAPSGFVVDRLSADGTTLIILPKDSGKEPLQFQIRTLTMRDLGPATPASFRASLTNAKPPGSIDSTGNFGPWDQAEPGNTAVSGSYTFRDADLSVFRGISGTLSSEGSYRGVLDQIETDGHTDTPDFTVKIAGNPVHLVTQFHAVVDGTDGNTWLKPVYAQFGHSSLQAEGGITGVKGVKGKTVNLNVTALNGRLEDMLLLAVKEKTPPMSGLISFHTKLLIPPGDIDIAQKLQLDGMFQADSAEFSQLNVQEKVNQLSHRGEGDPTEPETDTVASNFSGRFRLENGLMTFERLSFRVPGAVIALQGSYGLLNEQLNFHGTARLEADLSQTTTGLKSFFLKALNPFFRNKRGGTVLPIRITGMRDKPSFGLDIARHS